LSHVTNPNKLDRSALASLYKRSSLFGEVVNDEKKKSYDIDVCGLHYYNLK